MAPIELDKPEETVPEGIDWSRWACTAPDRPIHFTPVFPDLPIVMVTTESSPEMNQKMQEAGANGIIHKPFPPAELKKQLGKYLK